MTDPGSKAAADAGAPKRAPCDPLIEMKEHRLGVVMRALADGLNYRFSISANTDGSGDLTLELWRDAPDAGDGFASTTRQTADEEPGMTPKIGDTND